MSRLRRTMLMLVVAAFAFALVKPCSAQSFRAGHSPKGTHATHAGTSDHYNNHWHSNDYSAPVVGYYPYAIPYSYGYGRYGAYYPYGSTYLNYGYPVNLNAGYQRGFQYGNSYINPNFGN